VSAEGLQNTLAGGGKPQYQLAEFDSKAMRRIEEGFGCAVMLQNCHASHGLRAIVSFSSLSSLS